MKTKNETISPYDPPALEKGYTLETYFITNSLNTLCFYRRGGSLRLTIFDPNGTILSDNLCPSALAFRTR